MKTILLSLFILVQPLVGQLPAAKPAEYVYVCENGKTEVYHIYQCSALKRCNHEVSKITVSAARARGLRVCGVCR